MTFGLKAFNLLDAARACPNYVLGLGNTGHGCKLDGDHCKLFRGLPCGPFKRMNPNLFQPTLGSTESNPDVEPELPASGPDLQTEGVLNKKVVSVNPGFKTCECGATFTPGSNRQARCADCSAKRRRTKQQEYLCRFRKRKHLEAKTT